MDQYADEPTRRIRPTEGQIVLGTAGDPTEIVPAGLLAYVYRLADPALTELALEPLLDELLGRIKDILDVDTVAILLIDEAGEELVARAAKGLEEEVRQGVRIPIGRGFAGRIAAERAAIFIADVDHADVLNPILRLTGIRSMLGVPLTVEGEVIGVLHVGSLTPREFTSSDAALLQLAAAQAAPAIDRARLVDAYEREHSSAIALQRSLLPERMPELVGVEVAARYLPARDEVGGDWYDAIELPGDQIGVAIGDVAGHGVRAAALMGQLRTGLRAYALEGHPPAEALKLVDRLLQTSRERGMATVGYAVLDTSNGELRYASAGHPPPVLIGRTHGARIMEIRKAPPLGTLPFPAYHETVVTLEPGDTLLLYTDGLVERRGEPLTAGLERLRMTVGNPSSAEALCARVVLALVPEGGDDDIALLALRTLPVEPDLLVRFAADPDVLARIRQMLRRWLRGHGANPTDVASLTLAVGEACANAIEHAYAPGPASFELEAAHDAGVVTLTVRDTGSWRPPRGEHRGRGLKMIEAAVDEVDVRATGAGTEVLMRQRLAS